jgi:hypothetical protein
MPINTGLTLCRTRLRAVQGMGSASNCFGPVFAPVARARRCRLGRPFPQATCDRDPERKA